MDILKNNMSEVISQLSAAQTSQSLTDKTLNQRIAIKKGTLTMTPIARSPEPINFPTKLVTPVELIDAAGELPKPTNDNGRSVSLLERRRKRQSRRSS